MKKIIYSFLILLAGMVSAQAANTFDELVQGITQRSEGLTFISETDSDVVVWYRTRAVDSNSAENFRRVAKLPPLKPIEERTFESFFTRLVNYDPSGRWEKLQNYLLANLSDPKIFRVQQAAPFDNYFDVYAVGLFEGKIIGIHVVSLET